MEKKLKFNEILKGKRLILKSTKPDVNFAIKYFKVVDSNRQHLRPWMSWEKDVRSLEDALRYFFEKEKKTNNCEVVEYGIYCQDNYIGSISIFDIDLENKSGEVGYWLSANEAGKGYMTEALTIIEKEAFDNWQLNRIQLTCDPENKASVKVAKKCNYVLEGMKRQDFFCPYFKQFRDTLIFSKLRNKIS
ncbi:MAG: GNAT family protein [Patescibacteria group bacterium]|jgi:ribosomal-protein-serine acetyltransferase|nr:GNAT family protein [Patescibacteria group bacterium]